MGKMVSFSQCCRVCCLAPSIKPSPNFEEWMAQRLRDALLGQLQGSFVAAELPLDIFFLFDIQESHLVVGKALRSSQSLLYLGLLFQSGGDGQIPQAGANDFCGVSLDLLPGQTITQTRRNTASSWARVCCLRPVRCSQPRCYVLCSFFIASCMVHSSQSHNPL